MQTARFLKAFWALARPYWVSDERARGLGLLAAVVGLSLGLVYLNVQFNTWYNDFYNTMQEKRAEDFWPLIGWFTFLAFVYIWAAVYRLYLRQMLEIEWRKWLNERYLQNWLGERAYYKLQLLARGTDNPDQRIAEDLRLFVQLTLQLGLGLLSAVVTLVTFVAILWTLSGALQLAGISIPGYMVWAALVYAILGTWVTHKIGKPLIGLEFDRQRVEADYRFALVRLRENSEGVALYRGEKEELVNFRERFAGVITNWWSIMRKQKQLGFFTISYDQLAIIFPLVVAAPR
jgi:putative ATP-binding cassette transporter